MDLVTIYETAARKKFRFPYKGTVNVEDLWDLSPEALDSIFKNLNAQVKTIRQEESLLSSGTEEDVELNMKIALIRHIVSTKVAEKEIKLHEKERAEKRQRIMELIEKKKDENLNNMSEEELKALLAQI